MPAEVWMLLLTWLLACAPLEGESLPTMQLAAPEQHAVVIPSAWDRHLQGAVASSGSPICLDGEVLGCFDHCVPDTVGDGVCDPHLVCGDRDDGGDCEISDPPPPACADDELPSCWQVCVPAALAGDGACDPELACPIRGWDGGDCAADGPTISGDVVVREARDLAGLSGVAHLEGRLVVEAADLSLLSLPDLVSVGGLLIRDSPRLTVVDLPQLEVVGRDLELSDLPALQVFDAPALELVSWHLRLMELPRFDRLRLPRITHVGRGLRAGSVPELPGLQLGSLQSVGFSITLDGLGPGPVDLPQLRSVGQGISIRQSEVTSLVAPLLTTMANPLELRRALQLQVVDLRRLISVPAVLVEWVGSAELRLDALEEVDGWLTVRSAGRLIAPSLRTAGTGVSLSVGVLPDGVLEGLEETGQLRIDGTCTVDRLELASLIRADSIEIVVRCDQGLSFEAPELQEAGVFDLRSTLSDAALPALEIVHELLAVSSLRGWLDLPALRHAPLMDIYVNGAATEVRLDELRSLRAARVWGRGGTLDTFAAPRLRSVERLNLEVATATLELTALEDVGCGEPAVPWPEAQVFQRLTERIGWSDRNRWGWGETHPTPRIGLYARGRSEGWVLPSLRRARLDVSEVNGLQLPQLEHACELDLTDVVGGLAPALTEVDVMVLEGVNGMSMPFVRGSATLDLTMDDASDVDLRGLRELRSLFVQDPRRDRRPRGGFDWTGSLRGDTVVRLDGLQHAVSIEMRRSHRIVGIELPALQTVGSLTTVDLPWLAAVEAPALQTAAVIELQPMHRAQLGSLEQVERLVLDREGIGMPTSKQSLDLDLGALVAAGDVTLAAPNLGVLALPRLEEAQRLRIGRDFPDHLTTVALADPSASRRVELPALRTVGELDIMHTRGFDVIRLPSLAQIDDKLRLIDLPDLRAVELSGLVRMQGPGWLNLVNLPDLVELSLPRAEVLGRIGLVGSAVQTLRLPRLRILNDHLAVYDNPLLTTLEAPHLARAVSVYLDNNPQLHTLSLAALVSTDELTLWHLDALVTASFPALTDVPVALVVRNNPSLETLELDVLTGAGSIVVADNPLLDVCPLEPIFEAATPVADRDVQGTCLP